MKASELRIGNLVYYTPDFDFKQTLKVWSIDEQIEKAIEDKVITFVFPEKKTGGQSCGIIDYTVKLICSHPKIEISINLERSLLANKELTIKALKAIFNP